MSIPESQLETWARLGSVAQSRDTYATIKRVLEHAEAPYAGKDYEVFLQGSYGNDTNVFAESDVDVVIKLSDCFQRDLSKLSEAEQQHYHACFSNATYTHTDFKGHVIEVLGDAFGADAKPGNKAVKIVEGGGRRNADVVIAIQYRRYRRFNGLTDQDYEEGICFYDSANKMIANYPKQHSANLTKKHQSTNQWFKPMVRILKNMRNRMIDEGMIGDKCAPSYYLEGLLFNVPDDRFGSTFGDTFVNSVSWIQKADRTKFVCANWQYYLLRDGSAVSWPPNDCDEFLRALVKFWNEWA